MVCQESVGRKIVKPESTAVSRQWCFFFEVRIWKNNANKQSNPSSVLYLINFGACREKTYKMHVEYFTKKDSIKLLSWMFSFLLQKDPAYYYGYVYFRQVRDKSLKRGYFQKVISDLLGKYWFGN